MQSQDNNINYKKPLTSQGNNGFIFSNTGMLE